MTMRVVIMLSWYKRINFMVQVTALREENYLFFDEILLMIWQLRQKIITDVSQEVKHLSNFFNKHIHEPSLSPNRTFPFVTALGVELGLGDWD